MSKGNIPAETHYDPFPKSGRVKQYEPFIRKYVGKFRRNYPRLRYDDLLSEAVRLAYEAEKSFKPGLGNDFSTFLRGHLKGLHRFVKRESWEHAWSVPRDTPENLRREREEETREAKLLPGDFHGGANATRVTLDLNGVKARATLRVQLGSVLAEHILALWNRASPDVHYLAQHDADPMVRIARIRAVLDHHERRQDEIEQEAENRSRGDFGSVFLKARPKSGGVNLQHGQRRKPPNLEPDRIPMASLDDAYSHDDEWVGKLSDTIVAGDTPADHITVITEAFAAERPFLNPRETRMADWMLNCLSASDKQLVDFAVQEKISKGYASKLRDRVAAKIAARFKRNEHD
jgi:hypothetical protein